MATSLSELSRSGVIDTWVKNERLLDALVAELPTLAPSVRRTRIAQFIEAIVHDATGERVKCMPVVAADDTVDFAIEASGFAGVLLNDPQASQNLRDAIAHIRERCAGSLVVVIDAEAAKELTDAELAARARALRHGGT